MIIELLVLGVAITLFPFPLVAFVLALSTERGIRKGVAFTLAWLACLVAVIAMVLLLTGGTPPPPKSAGSTAAVAVKLAVGAGLVLYGEYRRRRVKVRERTRPAWLGRLYKAGPWTAAGLAVLLQPWGMVTAAAATIVQADLSDPATFWVLFGFCALATSSQIALELHMVFSPASAQARLERLREWLETHQDQAIVVMSLLLGFWLVAKSLSQLV